MAPERCLQCAASRLGTKGLCYWQQELLLERIQGQEVGSGGGGACSPLPVLSQGPLLPHPTFAASLCQTLPYWHLRVSGEGGVPGAFGEMTRFGESGLTGLVPCCWVSKPRFGAFYYQLCQSQS